MDTAMAGPSCLQIDSCVHWRKKSADYPGRACSGTEEADQRKPHSTNQSLTCSWLPDGYRFPSRLKSHQTHIHTNWCYSLYCKRTGQDDGGCSMSPQYILRVTFDLTGWSRLPAGHSWNCCDIIEDTVQFTIFDLEPKIFMRRGILVFSDSIQLWTTIQLKKNKQIVKITMFVNLRLSLVSN
jgi:hypothetical protein